MKTKKILNIGFISSLLLLFFSCRKYEDGPTIGLGGPTYRLTDKVWEMEKVILNDSDYTAAWKFQYPGYEIIYKSNYTYSVTWASVTTKGKWEFQNKKRELVRIPDGFDRRNVFTIKRLSANELWLSYSDDFAKYDTQLKKKK